MLNTDILVFVSHNWNCDAVQPMWHKGPCDCGLYALLNNYKTMGLSEHPNSKESLTLLYQLQKADPNLFKDWENENEWGLPKELFWCLKCGHVTAEKKLDIYGWYGYCHCCGMISQSQVGSLEFSTSNV